MPAITMYPGSFKWVRGIVLTLLFGALRGIGNASNVMPTTAASINRAHAMQVNEEKY